MMRHVLRALCITFIVVVAVSWAIAADLLMVSALQSDEIDVVKIGIGVAANCLLIGVFGAFVWHFLVGVP